VRNCWGACLLDGVPQGVLRVLNHLIHPIECQGSRCAATARSLGNVMGPPCVLLHSARVGLVPYGAQQSVLLGVIYHRTLFIID
jgi:hypothetical protein